MQHKVRRILIALAIWAVLFGGLVTAGGTTTVTEGGIDGRFTMASKRPGDTGMYHVVFVDENDAPLHEPVPYLRFHMDRQNVLDGHGEAQTAWVTDREVWVYGRERGDESGLLTWRPDSIGRFATTDDVAIWQVGGFAFASVPRVEEGPLGLNETRHSKQGTQHMHYQTWLPQYPLWNNLCMLHVSMVDEDLSKPLWPFREACVLPRTRFDPDLGLSKPDHSEVNGGAGSIIAENATIHAVALSDDEVPVLTMVVQSDEIVQAFWFRADTPYAIQVADLTPNERGHRAVYILSDLRRGPASELKPLQDAPDLVHQEAKEWGFPDEGFTGYLPSQAWSDAKEDAAVAAWMRDHPDHKIARIEYREKGGQDESEHHMTWAWELVEGTEQFRFSITWSDAARAGSSVTGPFPVLPRDGPSIQVKIGSPWSRCLDVRDDPMPTLTSSQARGEAFMGSPVTSIKWFPRCSDDGLASVELGSAYTEEQVDVDTDSLTLVESWQDVSKYLFMRNNGVLYSQIDTVFAGTTSTGVVAPPKTAPQSTDVVIPDTRLAFVPTVAVAMGGLALLAAALYYFAPTIKSGALGLFSRIAPDKVLDHPVRQELVQAIESRPGIHTQALTRSIGSGYGNTQHHLDKLVAAGHIKRHDAAGYVCYFPKQTDRRVVAAAPALRSDAARRVLDTIMSQPGSNGAALAKAVGINRGTLSHHVKRLEEAGVVESRRDGRALLFFPTEVAHMVLGAGIAS